MERELPTINIEGAEFLVDVAKMELREKDNPENTISVFEMWDRNDGTGYVVEFVKTEKVSNGVLRGKTVTAKIPEMITLDPEGMSQKYGVPLELFATKTDFDIMVDQTSLKQRLSGLLPVVDIVGHPFYVDIRMGMLRPKDDFMSQGIRFSEIENYYDDQKDMYWIPYNPKTHEFQEIDWETITEIPKDIIPVSFPHETILDPIGYNRIHGFDELSNLKETNVKSHFKAVQIPWKETGLLEMIKENKAKSLNNKNIKNNPEKKGKGRKL
ncbi:MAG: hypothetical protein J7577_23240 [Sphingobacteriaceae bacterium]|nr:hypothetical protein [Sphingobacteriaceae bacterium]